MPARRATPADSGTSAAGGAVDVPLSRRDDRIGSYVVGHKAGLRAADRLFSPAFCPQNVGSDTKTMISAQEDAVATPVPAVERAGRVVRLLTERPGEALTASQ